MNSKIKNVLVFFLVIVWLICLPLSAFAHSGRTDSNGGHRDNKNASGLGPYHYHCGGYPPHLHPNGICPYAPQDTITVSNMPSSINIGDSVKLHWTIINYSGSSQVSWSSSDSSIISVSSDGKLSALRPGTVIITALMKNGSRTFSVTANEVMATEIQLRNVRDRLEVNDTLNITHKIMPSNTTNTDITWSSSNPEIATIVNGKIKALRAGNVIISAIAANGIRNSFSLEVYEILPESIEVTTRDVTIKLDELLNVVATVTPRNTTKKEIEWTSSNREVASVDNNGNIVGNALGNTIITATCQNISTSISVEVIPIKAERIEFDVASIPLILNKFIQVGKSFSPVTIIDPLNATYRDITFQTSDESIINVTDNILSAIGTGNAIITASTKDVSVFLEVVVINYYYYLTGLILVIVAAFFIIMVKKRATK